MLDILETWSRGALPSRSRSPADFKKLDPFRIDGSTPQDERYAQVNEFNSRNDKKRSLFLLSTRASGLGINLTGADTVIFFDSDWVRCLYAQC